MCDPWMTSSAFLLPSFLPHFLPSFFISFLFPSSFLFLPFPSFWAAAPKGSMTYAFTHMGNFLLLLLLLRTPPPPSLQAYISAWRPISQPRGPNPSLDAQIPREWNLGLGVEISALKMGFEPQDWDLGLQAGIWASRLRYGPGGWGEGGCGGGGEGEEGGENSPYV